MQSSITNKLISNLDHTQLFRCHASKKSLAIKESLRKKTFNFKVSLAATLGWKLVALTTLPYHHRANMINIILNTIMLIKCTYQMYVNINLNF